MAASSSDHLSGAASYVTHVAAVFSELARRQPEQRALVWSNDRHTTYGELDRTSNQLARLLVDRGVARRDVVCICADKSLAAYASILACLKVGAPYVVVDPANPPARTRAMMNRCTPALAIVEPALAATDPAGGRFGCEMVVTTEDDDVPVVGMDRYPDDAFTPPWSIDGSDPAYVMFTSGSTGTPKGAVISHGNLLNFIRWSRAEFGTTADDVFTNLNPLFFDNSVFDIYSSLFAGAALAPFTTAALKSPAEVVARLAALGCTLYFSVPSLLVYLQTLKLIDRGSFPSLRAIVFGGEGYPKPMLAKLFEQVGDRIALHNVYGPTECTCICSTHRITSADFADMSGYASLGGLIPNFSDAIFDDTGRPVAEGSVGELYLGGPCVGLGYLGDLEQTTAAFVQNPTHSRFFDRMYRTGDLVRRDPEDGRLWFVGRVDSQIKHQGYRIELGEIEHALTAIVGVDEAAALHVTAGGRSRIVGVVASSGDLHARDVKVAVRQALPHYMIPEQVVVVPRLLKNANGKTDRRGLADAVARGEL